MGESQRKVNDDDDNNDGDNSATISSLVPFLLPRFFSACLILVGSTHTVLVFGLFLIVLSISFRFTIPVIIVRDNC